MHLHKSTGQAARKSAGKVVFGSKVAGPAHALIATERREVDRSTIRRNADVPEPRSQWFSRRIPGLRWGRGMTANGLRSGDPSGSCAHPGIGRMSRSAAPLSAWARP